MEVSDAEDLLETAHVLLDDLWKLDEFRYPQERMEHLMEIIGISKCTNPFKLFRCNNYEGYLWLEATMNTTIF